MKPRRGNKRVKIETGSTEQRTEKKTRSNSKEKRKAGKETKGERYGNGWEGQEGTFRWEASQTAIAEPPSDLLVAHAYATEFPLISLFNECAPGVQTTLLPTKRRVNQIQVNVFCCANRRSQHGQIIWHEGLPRPNFSYDSFVHRNVLSYPKSGW